MDNSYSLSAPAAQLEIAAAELRKSNEISVEYGLYLTDRQICSLLEERSKALQKTGRIEFGSGTLKLLAESFCSSPYISREDYEDTLKELQECFYYYKNESENRISDEDLISFMREKFDGVCGGSLEYLAGTSLEELCRGTRYGYKTDDAGFFCGREE